MIFYANPLFTFRAITYFLERDITFETAAVRTAITGDDAGEATDWIAVNWVIHGTITDAFVMHFTDD